MKHLDSQDWQNVLIVMRSAPLKNMAQAVAVNDLIEKVQAHANYMLAQIATEEPEGGEPCSD